MIWINAIPFPLRSFTVHYLISIHSVTFGYIRFHSVSFGFRYDSCKLSQGGFLVRFLKNQDEGEGAFDARVGGYTLPHGRWFHYAATYDDVSLRVFVDGKVVASKMVGTHTVSRAAASGATNNEWFTVGALEPAVDLHGKNSIPAEGSSSGTMAETANKRFDGRVDDVAVWAEGRTEQLVLQDMVGTEWGNIDVLEETAGAVGNIATTDVQPPADVGVKRGSRDVPTPAYFYSFDEDAESREVMPEFADKFRPEISDGDGDPSRVESGQPPKLQKAMIVTAGAPSNRQSGTQVGITEARHSVAVHVWRNCPGATATEETTQVCGGRDKDAGKDRGWCAVEEDPPTCHCNEGYTGAACATTCVPHPEYGQCHGHGSCRTRSAGASTEHLTTSSGIFPGPDDLVWCECDACHKGKNCEHVCPYSHDLSTNTCSAASVCSGHGECIIDEHAKKRDKAGATKKQTGAFRALMAFCKCQEGYYGVGCQKQCVGTSPGKTCAGHGECKYEDATATDKRHHAGAELHHTCYCHQESG